MQICKSLCTRATVSVKFHQKTTTLYRHEICTLSSAMIPETSRFKDIGGYTGAGAGIAVFALYGFLPSSFLGGIVALNMLGAWVSPVATAGVVERFVVALFMGLSVLLAACAAGFAGGACGRLVGTALDRVRASRPIVAPRGQRVDPQVRAKEEREAPRAFVSAVVNVEAQGKTCVADMKDLSEKGARLLFVNRSFTVVERGQRLLCRLPGDVFKESRVVWKRDTEDQCVVGIEFISPDGLEESASDPVVPV